MPAWVVLLSVLMTASSGNNAVQDNVIRIGDVRAGNGGAGGNATLNMKVEGSTIIVLPQGGNGGAGGNAFGSVGNARTYRVTRVASNDVLNIRQDPSAAARIVGVIPPNGRQVIVQVNAGKWWKVSYGGVSGWVNSTFLSPD